MGSGKTTLGKELATSLNYNFLDLDDYISDKEHFSISDLFQSKGEIYFRRKETQYLNEIINSTEDVVIALGGGTPCYANNMESIISNPEIISFYLKLSIPILAKRLFNERANRPLISHLNSEEELMEYIGKHLFERSPYYSQAHHIINANDIEQQAILEELLTHLI